MTTSNPHTSDPQPTVGTATPAPVTPTPGVVPPPAPVATVPPSPAPVTPATPTPVAPAVEPAPALAPAPVTPATPTDYSKVSPLASENLTGLLDDKNPYVQQARTRGEQYANSRGLLNSSLGAQYGEAAAIEAAAPIAAADAQFGSNKMLQDDQLAVQIMNSDMSQGSKDAALDFILGTSGTLTTVPATPEEEFGDYKDVKSKFDDYSSFLIDSDATSYWKTDPSLDKVAEETGREEFQKNLKPIMDKLGLGQETFTHRFGAGRVSGSNVRLTGSPRAKLNSFISRYGTWANAERAAKTWLGDNANPDDILALIKSTI